MSGCLAGTGFLPRYSFAWLPLLGLDSRAGSIPFAGKSSQAASKEVWAEIARLQILGNKYVDHQPSPLSFAPNLTRRTYIPAYK